MNKKFYRILLISVAGLALGFILFLQPRITANNPSTMTSFHDYELYQDYLLGQNYIQEGAVPPTIKKVYFVDAQGRTIDYRQLPFEWDVWLAEKGSYGAIAVTRQELRHIVKKSIIGHRLAAQAFALVLHIKPKETNKCPQDYYLKLEYEVFGIKKHFIRKAVTM